VATSSLESHFLNVLRPNSGTNLVDTYDFGKISSLEIQDG
jgi:hypothetical protein